MTLRARAMSGLRWIVGARLLAQVFTWVITLVVIRLLSPGDYGLLAMATFFMAFLGMMSELGLGPAVVQSADVSDAALRKVFGVVLVTRFALTGLLMVAAPGIALFFDEPRLVAVVRVLSLQFVIGALSVIPSALLVRRMEFRSRSLVDLVTTVMGSLVVLALAVAGFGVWALVMGSLATNALSTIGIQMLAPYWRRPHFALEGMKSLLSFGGRITLVQLLWFVYNRADVLIVGKWLGKELLGFYSVSMHVASMPNQRLSALINQIAFPTFARIQHDLEKVADVLLMAVRVLGFIAFPLFWGISSVAPEIVAVVLGSKWGPAVAPLQLLALVMPLRLINTAVANAVQGLGRADCVLRNVMFAVVLTPPILLAGTNWGLIGVSLAWLLASPIVFVQNMVRNLPVTGIAYRQFWRSIAPTAGSALVMYGAVTGAREMLPVGWPGWIKLGTLVLVGVTTFAAVARVTNRRGAYEVLQLAREVLKPRKASVRPT